MTSTLKPADRFYKTCGGYAMAALLAALAVGLTAEPARADWQQEQQMRHEQQENERHWRKHQRRRRVYVVPPGDEYYAPPPTVYYYPQPVAPSFSIIVPLRIH